MNSFPLRCLVYIGKETLPEAERDGPVSEAVVMHLCRHSVLLCVRTIVILIPPIVPKIKPKDYHIHLDWPQTKCARVQQSN